MDKKKLTEKQVLERLGIDNFRQLSKDKVVEFASMLGQMEPEVAVKALEQIPNATEAYKAITIQLKETASEAFKENNSSVQSYYATCDSVIKSLQKQLDDDRELTFEQRQVLIQQMISLAQMKDAKDTENKEFILKIIQIAASVALVFGLSIAAILGVNFKGLLGNRNIDI